jgi:hypothetical protein
MRSLFVIVFLAAIVGCKNDPTSTKEVEAMKEQGPIKIVREDGSIQVKPNNNEIDLSIHFNTTVSSGAEVIQFRKDAQSILEKRILDQPRIPSIIDQGTFFFQFIVKGSEISEVGLLDNKYIDFKEDNTYSYGINKTVDGTGVYHYTKDGILLMIDDDPTRKPQEFQAKHGGDSLVLVGRPTYKDNNMQMKLEKVMI